MKTFIVYECRYNQLISLLKNKTYSDKIMGEINWFMCLIKQLKKNNHKVHLCANSNIFKKLNHIYKNAILIMDFQTIPEYINMLNLNNTYCMCYWGRNDKSIKDLGNKNGNVLSLKNVLTPFDYNKENTFLGYNLDILCSKVNIQKYNNEYGIIWGKDIEYININFIKYLTNKGIKFYSTSKTIVNIDGVINLGILPRNEWMILLDNCKFIIGSGNPPSGPTILESLYYKTPLFCPKKQIPTSCQKSKNIHLINNIDKDKLITKINNVKFINDDIYTNNLINSELYKQRVNDIFNLL